MPTTRQAVLYQEVLQMVREGRDTVEMDDQVLVDLTPPAGYELWDAGTRVVLFGAVSVVLGIPQTDLYHASPSSKGRPVKSPRSTTAIFFQEGDHGTVYFLAHEDFDVSKRRESAVAV